MADKYAGLTDAEFDRRLREMLLATQQHELVDLILEWAYEEFSELYNNAILDEWEFEQEEEAASA